VLERMVRVLVCPKCGGSLDRDFPQGKTGGRVRFAELSCRACRSPYCIRDGVGLLAQPNEEGGEWRPDPGLLHGEPDEARWERYLASLPPEVPPAYERAIAAIIEGVRGVSGVVVDLATCRGHVLVPLAAVAGSNQLLLGTDPDVSQLFGTQNILKRTRHYTGVSLIEMDAERWPLRPAAASAAFTFYGPGILPHGRRIVQEAARVLREDSPFMIATLLTDERTITLRQAARRNLEEILTEKRLRNALEHHGFVVDDWQVLVEGKAWPFSNFDPLPARGDPWRHVLVTARRGKR
jgi:ubiquinone/menaquinone biosynthesis C-methylase UbiE/uncharacterized protein YbaR (Trm112 family)